MVDQYTLVEFIRSRPGVTARDVSEHFGEPVKNSAQRLRRTYESGFLDREWRNNGHTYRAKEGITPPEPIRFRLRRGGDDATTLILSPMAGTSQQGAC